MCIITHSIAFIFESFHIDNTVNQLNDSEEIESFVVKYWTNTESFVYEMIE